MISDARFVQKDVGHECAENRVGSRVVGRLCRVSSVAFGVRVRITAGTGVEVGSQGSWAEGFAEGGEGDIAKEGDEQARLERFGGGRDASAGI